MPEVQYYEALTSLFNFITNVDLTVTRLQGRRETPWGIQVGVFTKPTNANDERLFIRRSGDIYYPIFYLFENEITENNIAVGDTGTAVKVRSNSGNEFLKFKKHPSTI